MSIQKWEYKLVLRLRGWKTQEKGQPWQEATTWDIDIEKLCSELGEQGWELVSVSPRSSVVGYGHVHGFVAFGGGQTEGHIPDYAGFTDQEMWVFKRPKNEGDILR